MKIKILFFTIFCVVLLMTINGCYGKKSNILLILTDDLDSVLNGMKPLRKTRKWIANYGVTFTQSFVSTPICCPSRSSILTGLYQHNTRVWNNTIEGNCSSKQWQNGAERRTFAAYLKRAGYINFYAGKYLNQYGSRRAGGVGHVPKGWDFWAGLVGNSKYYDYKLSINGKKRAHGSLYSRDYLTDVIGRRAKSFVNMYLRKNITNPFLMVLAPPAPHSPFTSAPQYERKFENFLAPRTKAFNYVEHPNHVKHWLINTQPRPLNHSIITQIDEIFRKRWRTLLSVDDMVHSIMKKLKKSKLLDNTYVIFTSDHGYHLGQFGLPLDKRQLYETDLRVPMLIRGPNIQRKSICDQTIVNIDLAPTILDMAKVNEPNHMDGKSFLPHITSTNKLNHYKQRESFLISYYGEHSSRGNRDKRCLAITDANMSQCEYQFGCKCQDVRNNTYNCIRTRSNIEDTIFCKFQDDKKFIEMYNLQNDKDQLYNLGKMLDKNTINKYEMKISQMKICSGYSECF